MTTTFKITALPNGPYKVEGAPTVQNGAGQPIDTQGKDTVFLCRCGQSAKKPFCDGTHNKIGFKAD